MIIKTILGALIRIMHLVANAEDAILKMSNIYIYLHLTLMLNKSHCWLLQLAELSANMTLDSPCLFCGLWDYRMIYGMNFGARIS